MEDYKRVKKDVSTNKGKQPPPAENEVRISHSKINTYVDVCLELLQKKHKGHIVLTGKGQNINKTVTVVELVKRKMQGTLHQYTQLGSISVVEQWEAIEDKELDSVQVNKKVPVMIVYLSLEALPELEATSGYQAPVGPDFS
ncbi:hypothetical protein EDC96DRAFT_162871 [Choanephora cucurbitarum]|nr:hypothetical protein EDC96DRAFT_162871 [Choanephora cucurbitarum]